MYLLTPLTFKTLNAGWVLSHKILPKRNLCDWPRKRGQGIPLVRHCFIILVHSGFEVLDVEYADFDGYHMLNELSKTNGDAVPTLPTLPT